MRKIDIISGCDTHFLPERKQKPTNSGASLLIRILLSGDHWVHMEAIEFIIVVFSVIELSLNIK